MITQIDRPKRNLLPLLVLAVSLLSTSVAFAQGSIFGSVTNSDLTTPANGEISFYGYLDDTDEEIRLESSVGAGYDAGNWYDDFQNYLTEAPGNPYDYHFYNTVNGEGYLLSNLMPNNSFQQEDVLLAAAAWPSAVGGLTGTAVSSSAVVINWNGTGGLTYHIYRRLATSSGSFFRLDDPSGSLSNVGVADSFFVDGTVDGLSDYHYLVIAEDGSGSLGPHSVILAVSSSAISTPIVNAIVPASGFTIGGTPVSITGSGFDLAGLTATVGGLPLAAQLVVSPFEITGLTPANAAGPADVQVTNSSSALASLPLVGGFTYVVNNSPLVTDIPDQTIAEGATFTTINLDDFVSDADNLDSEITWSYAGNTELTVAIDGARVATITIPSADWNGNETITFTATDPGLLFAEDAAIFTVAAVNDAPLVTDIPDQSVAEGATFTTINLDDFVSDIDNLDSDMIWSYAGNTELTVAIDVNRVATITIPSLDWNGSEAITFTATDPGLLADSNPATFTVTAVNDAPIVAGIPDQIIAEGATFALINLDDYATDIDNLDSDMIWTYSGNTDLSVSIDVNRVATVSAPSGDWNGLETITFRATDPGTLFGEDAAVFSVTAGNDAPVVTVIPDQTVAEGAAFTTINLDDFVSDVDNIDSDMVWTYAGNTALTVAIDVNRVATITIPDLDWNGSETITFTATDPGLLFSEGPTIFTVTAVNDGPLVTDIPDQAIAEGATFTTINLDDYVSDIDNLDSEMIWTYSGNTELTLSIDVNRVATITIPGVDWNGFEAITFTATDPGLLFAEDIATFTVSAGNDAPVVTLIADQTITEGSTFATINLDDFVSDVDNADSELIWTASGNVDLTLAIDVNRVATITIPDLNWFGAETITFTATDPGLLFGESSALFTVTGVDDDSPIMDPISAQVVYETANLNLIITASDPDGTIPTLSALNLPLGATFSDSLDGTGTLDFTPDYDQAGLFNVTFKAFDGVNVDSQVVSITVLNTNRVPLLAAIGAQSLNEGDTLNLPITATDPDNDLLILSTSLLPANAIFTDNTDGTGTLDFMPDFTQDGIVNITFYADDGTDIDSELVAITVMSAGNQAPVVDSIGPRFVIEGAVLNFMVTASDPDGPIPALSAINLPANATFGDSLNGSGEFNFTPDFTQAGVYGVTFIADDGIMADSEFVLVTVSELGNQPPVMAPLGPQVVNENDTLRVSLSATDPEGHNIVFSFASNQPMTGISIVDNFDGTGELIYIPDYFSSGVDTIRVFATDDGIPALSAVEIIEIITFDINQPPTLDPLGPFFVKVGRTLDFLVHVTDETASDSALIFLTASGLPDNSTFVDSGNGTGLFSFAPTASEVGLHSVRFIAIDNDVPPMSATIDVEITVVAVNAGPTLDPIMPQVVAEGGSLILPVTATDPDGTFPALSASGVNDSPLPNNASFVDFGDGSGEFTFNPGFIQSGLYGIEFRASDGIDIDKITVLVEVSEAGNQTPEIDPISDISVVEIDTLVMVITGSDPDGSIPSFSADFLPSGAEFVDSGNGIAVLTFTPYYTQQGDYDVYIMATDGELTDTAIFMLTVIDIGNQPPVWGNINDRDTSENFVIHFNVFASDVDSVLPILTLSGLPPAATFTDNLDYSGTVYWETNYDDDGTYPVTFYAADGNDPLLIDSVTIQIVINNSNRLPGIWPDPFMQSREVDEGDTLVFRVQSEDLDLTIPILSVSSVDPGFCDHYFVDSANGYGYLFLTPNFTDASLKDTIVFVAHDGDVTRYPDDSTVTQAWDFKINNVPVAPVLDSIPPDTVVEGEILLISINATNVDGVEPSLILENAPPNAAIFGMSMPYTFQFAPDYLQAGDYTILFRAISGALEDSQYVTITVLEAGNQAPYFEATVPISMNLAYGDAAAHHVVCIDPEIDPITISMLNPPQNTLFVDSGNGAASMVFTPTIGQLGFTYEFWYVATDNSGAADTMMAEISVVTFLRGDVNGDQQVNIADISYIVDYIFRNGAPPVLMDAGDVNFDTFLNMSDASYLVNYIFRSGPPPP